MNHKTTLSSILFLVIAALALPAEAAITFQLSNTGLLAQSSTLSETGVSLQAGDVILIAVASSNVDHGPLTVTTGTGSGSGAYVVQTNTNIFYQYNVTGAGTFDISYSTGATAFATAGLFAMRADSGELTRLGEDASFRNANAANPHSSTVSWTGADNPTYFGLYSSGSATTIPAVFDLGSQINGGKNRGLGWGDATSVTSVTADWTLTDITKGSQISLAAYAEVIPEPSTALLCAIGLMTMLRRQRCAQGSQTK